VLVVLDWVLVGGEVGVLTDSVRGVKSVGVGIVGRGVGRKVLVIGVVILDRAVADTTRLKGAGFTFDDVVGDLVEVRNVEVCTDSQTSQNDPHQLDFDGTSFCPQYENQECDLGDRFLFDYF